eukprot:g12209.t1
MLHLKFEIYEKGGHYPAQNNAKAFAPALVRFLKHGVGFWSHKNKGHAITVVLLIVLVFVLALGFYVD